MTPDHSSALAVHKDADISDVDLSKLLRTLWRGKFWIAFVALIALAIGVWHAYFQAVPTYTSRATVVLESRQDQVVDLDSVVTGLSGDQATINTEVEVIRSRGLLEKLVIRLNLLEDPEFNAALRPPPKISVGIIIGYIKSLFLGERPPPAPRSDRSTLDSVINVVLSSITVSNIRQSYVFQITAVTQDAQKSAAIANTLAELYILEQLETKFEATEQATAWLSGRVAELQIQLETAEAAVKDFNTDAQLVSPEALAALNRQIKDLRDRLADTIASKTAIDVQINTLQTAKTSGDLAGLVQLANDPTLTRTWQLIQESGAQNPDTSAFDARLEQIITRAQLESSRLAQQIQALEATNIEQEKQINSQSADLVRLQQLQREAEASRLIYEFFLNRLKETSVQQGIQRADSRMLSRAVVPGGPSAPRKTVILALSLILGTLLGMALVLMREYSQNTFRDATDLESRTGYTVIGKIPIIPARRRKNVLQYFIEKPTSAAAEAIRNLRTSLLLSNIDNPPQVIMSTSSIPGEGKTTQSLALAQNLTGLGKKVLLIEGDIRRRVFSEYFDIANRPDLLAILSGTNTISEAAVMVPELGADVIVAAKTKTNAADVFSSERFTAFLKEVRKQYDYIIIDTPPVLVVPDARIIGQAVDAIVYTVKWDSTSHTQVSEGLKSLSDVNAKVSGLVLGQINETQMKRYGYEAAGNYGSYYDN